MQEYLEKVREILKLLGLNKNEIIIYLDLLKNNPSSPLELSKRTKIHRSNTYDALRGLVEKGFASKALKDQKTIFWAIAPQKIKDYLKQQEQEFDIILPQLENFTQQNEEKSLVSISEGTFAAREALADLLNLNSSILVYGASKQAVEAFGQPFLKEFHKARIKKRILMRHIYDKKAIDRVRLLNKMKFTEAVYLSERYNTVASTAICSDTVLLFVFIKPVLVMKIINKEVGDAYRKYFELLWSFAK